MKLACIVLAHRLPKQLAQLVSVLRHPQVKVYVHIDRRKSLAPFTRAFGEAGVSDVALLPRHKSWWASPGILDAALEGLVAGVADGCDYFITISGQDFPLKSDGGDRHVLRASEVSELHFLLARLRVSPPLARA